MTFKHLRLAALLVALVFGRLIVALARRAGVDITHTTEAVGSSYPVFGFTLPLANDALALAYLCLVVGVSYLTWRLVERPGRRLFNRLADRLAAPADKKPSQVLVHVP